MGILDNLKNVLGSKRKDDLSAATTTPTQNTPDAEGVATPGAARADRAAADGAHIAAAGAAGTYTVVSGDTLFKIAATQYGDGSKFQQIFEANKDLLEQPEHIYPGQKLRIPVLDKQSS